MEKYKSKKKKRKEQRKLKDLSLFNKLMYAVIGALGIVAAFAIPIHVLTVQRQRVFITAGYIATNPKWTLNLPCIPTVVIVLIVFSFISIRMANRTPLFKKSDEGSDNKEIVVNKHKLLARKRFNRLVTCLLCVAIVLSVVCVLIPINHCVVLTDDGKLLESSVFNKKQAVVSDWEFEQIKIQAYYTKGHGTVALPTITFTVYHSNETKEIFEIGDFKSFDDILSFLKCAKESEVPIIATEGDEMLSEFIDRGLCTVEQMDELRTYFE